MFSFLSRQKHGDSWWQTQQDQSDLGEGDASTRQQRDGPGQVHQQPAGQGHGTPHQGGEWPRLYTQDTRTLHEDLELPWSIWGFVLCSRVRQRCSGEALETSWLPVHPRLLLFVAAKWVIALKANLLRLMVAMVTLSEGTAGQPCIQQSVKGHMM